MMQEGDKKRQIHAKCSQDNQIHIQSGATHSRKCYIRTIVWIDFAIFDRE